VHGTAFLVMEYLEGETLADRLTNGALPLDDALQVAVQIADALSAAHRHGIVHRDLKPGNMMLTKAGAKLLDFGLAKASGPAVADAGPSMLPTTPAGLTVQGTILGTVQYMAPEQIEGHEADGRTDIFAFGAVLHEMLTGTKAFSGASPASLIASILSSQPPKVSTVQTLAPAALDHLIARCLAKDPEDRWQSARDVKLELSWIGEARMSPSSPTINRRGARERLVWTLAGLTLVALSAILAATLLARRAPATAAEPVQFVIPPEKGSLIADLNAQAVSPDGRQIVFTASGAAGTPQLWIRRLDSLHATTLTGTDGGGGPFWSPDSQSVGFFAGGRLKTINVRGGPPQTLADAPFPLGGAWSRDGVILFGRALGSPLFRVSAGGGATTQATSLEQTNGLAAHGAPFFLPDGRHFFFVVLTGPVTGDVDVGALDSYDVKLLLRSNSAAVYSPSGHVLFLRETTLMAQPFDLSTLSTPDGEQIVFASARDGLLDLYRRASDASSPDELLLKLNAQPILFPSDWSADGRFLTYYRTDPKTQLDIWTLSLGIDRRSIGAGRPESAEGRKPVPFLQGDFNESQGQFSPDGRWIAYVSDESGGQQVYVQSFPTPTGQRQISTEGGTHHLGGGTGRSSFTWHPIGN